MFNVCDKVKYKYNSSMISTFVEDYLHLKGFGRKWVYIDDAAGHDLAGKQEKVKCKHIILNVIKFISYFVFPPLPIISLVIRERNRSCVRSALSAAKFDEEKVLKVQQFSLNGQVEDALFTTNAYKKLAKAFDSRRSLEFFYGLSILLILMAETKEMREFIPQILTTELDNIKSGSDDSFKQSDITTSCCIRLMEKQLNRKFDESEENAKFIALEIIKRKARFYFHGTNLSSVRSILQDGLTPVEEKRDYDAKELNEILNLSFASEIFGELGAYFAKRDRGKKVLYVAGNSPTAVYYAQNGCPEWFSHIIKEYGSITDLEQTKNNLMRRVKQLNLNDTQTKKIHDFFMKNWKLYGNPQAYFVLTLPRKNLSSSEIEKFFDWKLKIATEIAKKYENDSRIETVRFALSNCIANLNSVDETIDYHVAAHEIKVYVTPQF